MFIKTFIFCVLLRSVTCLFCYWNSGCPYKYFSSKTPYNNVRGDIRDSIIKLKGCQPISIWALISNGKTTPTEDFIRNFNQSLKIRDHVITSYKEGKCSLCAQDVENLQNWKVDNELLSKSNFISKEGSQELIGIANRLHQTFPNLIQNLQKGNYEITSASSKLATESAKIFVKGFKNEHLSIDNNKNDVVVPHKSCAKYNNLLQQPNSEVIKYMKTADYYATKDRIQRRLGIEYKLSDDSIKSLYDLCRYTWSGIESKFSPWCALFTTEDLRVLEYIGDLQHYYTNGYGFPTNELLGRVPLMDLLKKFQDAKNGAGKTIVTHFTDTATMNMVCAALNLFKDESPLSSTNKNSKRKWRTSKISVFSTNLIAVLNRCDVDGTKDYNVVIYWNEEPLLPICERGFCSWDEFQDKLRPFVNTTIADIC